MKNSELIIGLDIGSSNVRVVVAESRISDKNENKLHIIGAAEGSSEGVAKGSVAVIEDAVSSVSSVLEKVERLTGMPMESAWVGINGLHIKTMISRGIVAVSRNNGEIQDEDVERVIENSKNVNTPPNYEILHVIPKSFVVDSQEGIKDPRGMTGIRLEVEAMIVMGMSSQINNLTKCVYRTGLDIDDLAFSILACAEAVVTKKQKELGVAVVNIGAATTNIAVFEEGDIIHCKVIPLGADHITADLAIGLRVDVELAEQVKRQHGEVNSRALPKREEVYYSELVEGMEGSFSKKYVAEIIEARVEEIFSKIDAELKVIDRSGSLPAGIVLTGGGAKLKGVVEMAKQYFRLAATIGMPINVTAAIDNIDDSAFTTAVGLALWGKEIIEQTGSKTSSRWGNMIQKTISDIKGLFGGAQ